MTGVENKFAELKKAGKKGLIIYITAGIPDADSTVQLVLEAEKAGASAAEVVAVTANIAAEKVLRIFALTLLK